jgi:hypothetical protein
MQDQLFLYGTLRDRDLFHAVAGRPLAAFRVRAFRLAGYRAAELPLAPFPVLVRSPSRSAPGLAVAGLDRSSLARLIRYEGAGYALAPVKRLGDGSRLMAFLPRVPMEVLDEDWRIETWAADYKPAMLTLLRGLPPAGPVRKRSASRRG